MGRSKSILWSFHEIRTIMGNFSEFTIYDVGRFRVTLKGFSSS
jgi:hypothetical protein